MTWLVGITSRKFAQENPEIVRKLIRIHRRAVDYIYANRDDAMRIYAKVWNADAAQVAKYFPKYFTYEGEWSRGGFDKAALEKMSEGCSWSATSTGRSTGARSLTSNSCPRTSRGRYSPPCRILMAGAMTVPETAPCVLAATQPDRQ